MNDLALKRLTAAGWTPDRKVDCSEIEREYAEQHLELPQVLREFFSSFAFLRIFYVDHYGSENKHIISPRCVFEDCEDITYELEEDGVEGSGFDAYKKYDLQPLFAKFGIVGEIYPVGSTANGVNGWGCKIFCVNSLKGVQVGYNDVWLEREGA